AWVKFNALPSSGSLASIVSKDLGAGNQAKWIFGYGVNVGGFSNALFVQINTGTSLDWPHSASFVPPVGTWYHLAVVKADKSYTFYVNGAASGTATTTLAVPTVAAAFQVGRAESAYYLNGQVDDLRLWNTARTASQIATNLGATLTGSEAGL